MALENLHLFNTLFHSKSSVSLISSLTGRLCCWSSFRTFKMAMEFKGRILCVCLGDDGIFLIFIEIQIEPGQIRPPCGWGRRVCSPAPYCSPEWYWQVMEKPRLERDEVPWCWLKLWVKWICLTGFVFLLTYCFIGLSQRDQTAFFSSAWVESDMLSPFTFIMFHTE